MAVALLVHYPYFIRSEFVFFLVFYFYFELLKLHKMRRRKRRKNKESGRKLTEGEREKKKLINFLDLQLKKKKM